MSGKRISREKLTIKKMIQPIRQQPKQAFLQCQQILP